MSSFVKFCILWAAAQITWLVYQSESNGLLEATAVGVIILLKETAIPSRKKEGGDQ